MTLVLDGRETTDKVMEEVAAEVEALKARGVTPGLALVLTGDDKYSARYVKLKKRRAEKVGIYAEFHQLEQTTDEELAALIHRLNEDPKIHGIMVQLPLAEGLSELKAVDAIAPRRTWTGSAPTRLARYSWERRRIPPPE
jgi:methylenetetrahydrofolate dehydrogenase (NADP+)/methenyltetrahydrofolate cyclohydrolase